LSLDTDVLRKMLAEKMNGELSAYLDACVRCGLCASSCHYYLVDGETESIPGYKLNRLGQLYRDLFRFPNRFLPRRKVEGRIDEDLLDSMVDVAYGRCTMCARCGFHCSVGLDVSKVIHRLRSILTELDLVPKGLDSTLLAALETGNNMRITRDDWVETIKWLEEELRAEVSDDSAVIPLDRKGARILYAVNPREPKFFPLSLSAVAKVFHAARESWTLSSRFFDATNYSYYSGDDSQAARLAENILSEARRLGAQSLVISECGHGYYAARWHVPSYVKQQRPIPVLSILEVVWQYMRDGRIRVDPGKNQFKATLHDPCHLVRKGGIIREQREILKRVVSEFVEMTPNKEKNFCCSGGGGSLSMTAFTERRRSSGRVKAEQIRRTGAQLVASPCHNCIDQILELDRHYRLGVKVRTVTELVADALVLSQRK
jgi:Fe-S oxidoreductase